LVNEHTDEILEYSNTGELRRTMGGTGSADGLFNRPKRIARDRDGNFFVTEWDNDGIQQLYRVLSRDCQLSDQFAGLALDWVGPIDRFVRQLDESPAICFPGSSAAGPVSPFLRQPQSALEAKLQGQPCYAHRPLDFRTGIC
jgi:hypothetical protein